jgi:DNA repair protein RadA
MVKSKDREEKEEKKEEATKLTDIPGIGPGIATKLEAAGIYDLMGLAVMSPTTLGELAGVGTAVARKAIQAARSMMNLGFMEGTEFAKRREDVRYITTGSVNLNDLLGGKGIESRAITEAYGAFGSGKCVSKDTEVCYFNDTRMHVQTMEETYEKYKEKNGEQIAEEGFGVPVSTVKVMAWVDGKMKVVRASHLYKELVKKLFVIKTKRGRVLKVTGQHQLLGFDNGVSWRKSGLLKKGDIIASPRSIDLTTEKEYDVDDAYFLGIFVAEGTHNPFSITTGSEEIKDWLCGYVERKFGYRPTVRAKEGKSRPIYLILLRNATRNFMCGLDKCNASTKFIPEGIFLSNQGVVSSFLGGYFDVDAEVSKGDLIVTTKSKKLATQLTYLLLRLGISATIRDGKIEGYGVFKVVRIVGEDREKLREIKFKIKKFSGRTRSSVYGYPRQIVRFLEELYKESIGGNRERMRKIMGKINTKDVGYKNLAGKGIRARVINSKTLDKFGDIFESQKLAYVKIIKRLESEEFSIGLLREIYPKFPFAFSSLGGRLGIEGGSMTNYHNRKIPESRVELLRNLIINELKVRVDTICLALELIYEIRMFSWDVVESVEVSDYNDFVYDFVVPEGHSFIGGNMPTMMHNTQLALTLSVNAQLPKDAGGANGKVVYIDTEGTFRPDRIRQIAEGIGANPEKVLKNILVARAFNADHQILLLDKVSEMIKDGEPIRLLVVDSLTAHFRAEFAGRGQLADRQQKLNRYLHNLNKLSEQHNLAVYVTNQVMANPAMMFGDPTVHVGGHIVGHAVKVRMYLRRGKAGSRVAKMIDSPNLPENETVFTLSEKGVGDD